MVFSVPFQILSKMMLMQSVVQNLRQLTVVIQETLQLYPPTELYLEKHWIISSSKTLWFQMARASRSQFQYYNITQIFGDLILTSLAQKDLPMELVVLKRSHRLICKFTWNTMKRKHTHNTDFASNNSTGQIICHFDTNI